jgi:hypothetical protein
MQNLLRELQSLCTPCMRLQTGPGLRRGRISGALISVMTRPSIVVRLRTRADGWNGEADHGAAACGSRSIVSLKACSRDSALTRRRGEGDPLKRGQA